MSTAALTSLVELLALTRHLGEPHRDYVILGEGNTSARIDDTAFWVTTSGRALDAISDDGFVQVRMEAAQTMLRGGDLSEDAVRAALIAAKVDGTPEPRPSVETVVHAVCLAQPGVRFVGHTHPTAVNAITCSPDYERLLSGRLFPDEVVLCGPRPLLVPYVDPGLPLAREIHRRLETFHATHGTTPKVIYLQNHGVIALGASAHEVRSITAMVVKVARILIAAASTNPRGEVRFMPDAEVTRIHHRADEHYRQRVLGVRA
ncbi:MAG: class II aldolase [Phycisphaerae bacterium]|nr:class II aldolase [Phycisphaerae bacterium]